MKDISKHVDSGLTMTLKEITDLLEVRHNNAMRTVEKMAEEMDFGELLKISTSYKNNIGAELKIETYQLNKRQVFAVASRLNVKMQMRIIDRWQELEEQAILKASPAPLALTTAEIAERDVHALANIYDFLKVPKHIAVADIGTQIFHTTGLDITKALTQSEHCNDIQEEDVYLEPNDLGKRYGVSGIKMNKILAEYKLQRKTKGQWKPTDAGEDVSIRHSWHTGHKAGYNYKWNVSFIDTLMDEYMAA